MTDPVMPAADTALWTGDEIRRLVSVSGDAAETLSNIVRLIQERFRTDVCSVYLLEPDRSTLVLAATVGLRPESVGKIRMRLTEGLVGLVGERMAPLVIEHAVTHPRFKYFREAGEEAYQSFAGVPLERRGLLQGVLVVQTIEPRAFDAEAIAQLQAAGAQLAPIVSEARTLGLFVAPSHQRLCALAQNLWWSWDDEATALFRDLDPLLWRDLGHNPVAMLQRIDIDRLHERASHLVLHSRINYAYRRMQEYLTSTRTWGAQHAGVLWARPVAYFSAEFGLHESLPIYSGGLGILAGDHIKGASDLGVPLVGVGLYYHQAYFRQRLDEDGYQQEDYIDVDRRLLPMRPASTPAGEPVVVTIETRSASITRVSGSWPSGGTRCCCSTRTWTPTGRRTGSSPPGSTAATTGCACARRSCSVWAGFARSRRWASRPPWRTSTRATAPLPPSSWSATGWSPRASTRTRRCDAWRRRWSSPRTRPCPPGTTASPPS